METTRTTPNFMMIKVESDAAHTWVAAVVVEYETGKVVDICNIVTISAPIACELQRCVALPASDIDKPLLLANPKMVRDNFCQFYARHAPMCNFVSDTPFPAVCKFISECIDDKRDVAYPIMDLASILQFRNGYQPNRLGLALDTDIALYIANYNERIQIDWLNMSNLNILHVALCACKIFRYLSI